MGDIVAGSDARNPESQDEFRRSAARGAELPHGPVVMKLGTGNGEESKKTVAMFLESLD